MFPAEHDGWCRFWVLDTSEVHLSALVICHSSISLLLRSICGEILIIPSFPLNLASVQTDIPDLLRHTHLLHNPWELPANSFRLNFLESWLWWVKGSNSQASRTWPQHFILSSRLIWVWDAWGNCPTKTVYHCWACRHSLGLVLTMFVPSGTSFDNFSAFTESWHLLQWLPRPCCLPLTPSSWYRMVHWWSCRPLSSDIEGKGSSVHKTL